MTTPTPDNEELKARTGIDFDFMERWLSSPMKIEPNKAIVSLEVAKKLNLVTPPHEKPREENIINTLIPLLRATSESYVQMDVFEPKTAPEAYLLFILKEMYEENERAIAALLDIKNNQTL